MVSLYIRRVIHLFCCCLHYVFKWIAYYDEDVDLSAQQGLQRQSFSVHGIINKYYCSQNILQKKNK